MKKSIISIVFFLSLTSMFGQNVPEGMAYQAQVTSSSGQLLTDTEIGVRFNVRKLAFDGVICYQENHTIVTNNLGHISLVIGEGSPTSEGTCTSFSTIDWADGPYFLEMLVDENNNNSYVSSYTQQLMAVPFAFYSKTSGQSYSLSKLDDVDTVGVSVGDVLKWNGTAWVPQVDLTAEMMDTIEFSYHSDTATYALNSGFAENCISTTFIDSTAHSVSSDTANFAFSTNHSIYADSSNYANTASITAYSLGNWGLEGNDNITTENFIGTVDSTDFIIKTNNVERMRIKANGRIGIGTSSPVTDFQVDNIDGVLFTGNYGEGVIPIEGAGSRMMWYPGKSAFRAGLVTGNVWNDNFIGDYSFASGYNTKASGSYSVAFGNGSYATDEGSFAVGKTAAATGLYSFAAGHEPVAGGDYSIALGRAATSNGYSAIAIGYHPTASGNYAMGFGNYVFALAENSTAMGYHSRVPAAHHGSFVYADNSSESYLETTAANQFMVRAAGGTVFYTSADLSTGVTLAPGAGAWSTLSDRNRKENIRDISPLEFLDLLDNIEVYSWNYKSQNAKIRHIGPMAQDFHRTFGLGLDPKTINSGDFDGINLLLLKGLNQKLDELATQKQKINDLEKEIRRMKTQRQELEKMLKKIERKIE